MKPTLFLLSAAIAVGTVLTSANSMHQTDTSNNRDAYGFLIHDENGKEVGLYSFPINDCSNPTIISTTEKVSAGTMANGTYYAMTYESGAKITAKGWYSVNLNNGAFTYISDKTGEPLYVDMTYNYSENKMLGIYHHDMYASTLAEINPIDGTPSTIIAQFPNIWMVTVATNLEGETYMIGVDNLSIAHFYMLNENNTLTDIAQIPSCDTSLQTMDFDHETNKLYWASTEDYVANWYEINTNTGECIKISDIASNGELTGLYIPFNIADSNAPAAVSDIIISNPSHDSNIEIQFTLPTKTVNGNTLKSITGWKILANDSEITTNCPTNASPGEQVSCTASVSTGLHKFKVVTINEYGNGFPKTKKAFIGVDTPSAPQNINAVANGANVTVTWDPVTIGANNGWINSQAITYNVNRLPDNSVIATNITQTSVTDHVEVTNAYQYMVTATDGTLTGEIGVSDPIAAGTGIDLPYSCDFTSIADPILWSVIDANSDGKTWEYSKNWGNPAMLAESTYSNDCDEWLISPAFKLETGKEYKISFNAGARNPYYPPEFNIFMGDKAETASLSHELRSGIITDVYPTRSIIYLPSITTSGTYHIGIQAKSKKGLAGLYFNNFKIEENFAAQFKLKVTDATGTPISDAKINFGNNRESYVSDKNGLVDIIEIEPGKYTVEITKFGYKTFTNTYEFTRNEKKICTIVMESLPKANIKGKVLYPNGKPFENVSIYAYGYDEYSTITDKNGEYFIEGILVEGSYSVGFHATNYLSESIELGELNQECTKLPDITLQEKLIAPANILHNATRSKIDLSWDAPIDREETYRYDDGQVGMINSYEITSDISEKTVTGVSYETPAVYTGMSFMADNNNQIGIVIFDLDENGLPTNKILYEQSVQGDSWNWVYVQFEHPVIAPRGALFTLRGDSRIYFDGNLDGTRNDEWPVIHNKMWLSKNYETQPFSWKWDNDNAPIFGYNFCLRANGKSLGAPRNKILDIEPTPNASYRIWRLPDGSENNTDNWVQLNETDITTTTFTDTEWINMPKGMYRYAVKAVYNDNEVSYPVFLDAIPRLLTSNVTINITTNIPDESAANAAILLVEKNGSHSHTGNSNSEGSISFDSVWEGTYILTITKKGFTTLETEINICGESDYTNTFTLSEIKSQPSNIFVEETEIATSRLLRWNVVTSIFEDFESFDDFATNDPGTLGWTYIDGDDSPLYFSGTQPEGVEKAAFIIMNKETSGAPREFTAHSGLKAAFALNTSNAVDSDDYLISPELDFKNDFVINFWAFSYWMRLDEIRVGYSLTGKNLEDFIWIGEPFACSKEEVWENFTVNIPAGATYVVLNYRNALRSGGFDDIYIGNADEIPSITAPAKTMRNPGTPLKYEVWLDSNKITETTATEWLLENISEGVHTAGVKSIYASGESEMITTDFSIQTSGLTDLSSTNNIKIKTNNNVITISGHSLGSEVTIFTTDGRIVASSKEYPTATFELPYNGVYIVMVENISQKLILH